MHAVHGDEVSSSIAALMEAYHLLAARGDATVDAILRESIVIIDPLQNPDGWPDSCRRTCRARRRRRTPSRMAVERDQPWPGGRYNHYLFDMNRDWFAQTQLETRGRAASSRVLAARRRRPARDGRRVELLLAAADPLNPLITKNQQKWFDVRPR
jgi:hypothetical protein